MKYSINDIKTIDDISVSQYHRYNKAIENIEGKEAVMLKALEIFLDIEPQLLYNMDNEFIYDEASNIYDCLNQKPTMTDTVTIDGVTYSRMVDLNSLTFGQYIDLDTYLQEDEMDLGKIMGVFWLKGDKYDAGTEIPEFPLGQALASMDFFFNGEKDS